MLATISLVASLGPSFAPPALPPVGTFRVGFAAPIAPHELASPWLDTVRAVDARRSPLRLAQVGLAPATGTAATGVGTAADAQAVSDADAAAAEAAEIALLRARANLTRMHRVLGITTVASMAVTTTLGTLAAINQATAFGPGRCTGENAIFGSEFGCGGLSRLHEASAFVTVGLYTTTGVLAFAMPDPEHASDGSSRRATRLRIHRGFAWAHLAGMILEPLLGIVSAAPSVIGVQSETFASDMRTIHLFVGYATFVALTGAMITELVE